jgi:2-succinyl-5-enolpyruvyl-6-hydroxy-3-cyclohexene-1-carboxylate synthase
MTDRRVPDPAVTPAAPSALAQARVQATFCATLVDEWVAAGVAHAVVAPGSRSTPMALALVERDDLVVHVAHDERTAAFMALGIGVVTGRPAVLVCTSGTAATHFHAAVVEADLSGVPMLVVTADRPPELHGVGAPQTIEQTNLYGGAVRWFHDPGVANDGDRHEWRSMAQRSLHCALEEQGPVHLNLAFREPLVATPDSLPTRSDSSGNPVSPSDARASAVASVVDDMVRDLDRQRGVIVAGRGARDARDAIDALAEATGWPVLADARSGCRTLASAVTTADALLRHEEFASAHTPEVVLHLGEAPASKVLNQWLANSGAFQVRVIARDTVIDPERVISRHIHAPIDQVCRVLAERLTGATGTPWSARWRRAEQIADAVFEDRLSSGPADEPTVGRVVLRHLPSDAHLVVSSSMPVRDLEWYGGRHDDVVVHANRGANGIDGVVATALGVAVATEAPTAVLIGDIALLHDSSSLTAATSRGVDLRIVVVDNDGGGIFSFLPQAVSLPNDRFEQLFGTPHGTDIEMLGRAHGFATSTVTTVEELARAVSVPGPSLVRVVTDRVANVAAHDALHRAVAAAL